MIDKPQNKLHILVDTDVWVGFFLKNDPHHKKATSLLTKIRDQKHQIIITSAIISEVITVLSHKSGQEIAKKFLKITRNPNKADLTHVFLKEEFVKGAYDVFKAQNKKGTSYVDCSNVFIIKHFRFDHVLSFDKTYHKLFGINNLAYPNKIKTTLK